MRYYIGWSWTKRRAFGLFPNDLFKWVSEGSEFLVLDIREGILSKSIVRCSVGVSSIYDRYYPGIIPLIVFRSRVFPQICWRTKRVFFLWKPITTECSGKYRRGLLSGSGSLQNSHCFALIPSRCRESISVCCFCFAVLFSPKAYNWVICHLNGTVWCPGHSLDFSLMVYESGTMGCEAFWTYSRTDKPNMAEYPTVVNWTVVSFSLLSAEKKCMWSLYSSSYFLRSAKI